MFFFRYIYILSEPNLLDEDLIVEVFNRIIHNYKPFRIDFYSIPLSKFPFYAVLEKVGFNKIYSYSSVQIDLMKEEQEIFSEIHPKHRNKIRKAKKGGVKVFEDTSLEGLKNYHKLAEITYKRSGKKPPSFGYLLNHFKALAEKRYLRIFFAEKDGELQSSAICLVCPELAIYWHGASKNKPFPGASNLLHWEIMKRLKEEGVKKYDFGGINWTDAKAASISKFKARFGGKEIPFYGGYAIYNSFRDRLYNILIKAISLKLK